jgi:adenylate cyclase class IV
VGRLGLLVQGKEGAELIEYERPTTASPGRGGCQRLAVADPDRLRSFLAEELGVVAVVEKERRVLIKENVRIHLDHVDGLGDFIEAVAPPGHDPRGQLGQINSLRRLLGISDERLVSGAYADLLSEGVVS